MHSDAEVHSEQLTFQLSGVNPRSRTIFNASYSSRDQGSAGGYGFGRYGRGGSGGLGALLSPSCAAHGRKRNGRSQR